MEKEAMATRKKELNPSGRVEINKTKKLRDHQAFALLSDLKCDFTFNFPTLCSYFIHVGGCINYASTNCTETNNNA